MSGIGDQHLLARIALALEVGADQQQARQFALRAGGGLERGGLHAGDFEQASLQSRQDLQAALRELLRLIRMLGGHAFQARDVFVDARIVFHGAGAQRIHAQVDGVVPGGEPREVADHLDLAHFGEALEIGAGVIAQQRLHVDGGNVGGGSSMPRFPGADFSKIRPSFWLMLRAAFLILSANGFLGVCDPILF